MTEQAFPSDTTPLADGAGLEFVEPDLAQWQRDLHGLTVIGALECSFDYCGHKISIRTLRTDEELIVAALVKEWDATVGGLKAYATAMSALSLQTIDGQLLPVPLGETGSLRQWAVERFNYTQKLYPWVIDAIYTNYLLLEGRVKEVISELGKASAPGAAAAPGPSTSPGSLSAEGS